MIHICDGLKVAYFPIARTGSISFVDVLKKHGGFRSLSRGGAVPDGYRKMSIVRNPYDRAVSCFSWCQRAAVSVGGRPPVFKDCVGKVDTITDFLNYCIESPGKGSWGMRQTCAHHRDVWSKRHDGVTFDQWFKLEEQHELNKALGIELPHLDKGPQPENTRSKIVTPEVIDLINIWGAADFDMFGYERLEGTKG